MVFTAENTISSLDLVNENCPIGNDYIISNDFDVQNFALSTKINFDKIFNAKYSVIKEGDWCKLKNIKGIIIYSNYKPNSFLLNPNLDLESLEIIFIEKIFNIKSEKLEKIDIKENNIPTKIIDKYLFNLFQKKIYLLELF